MKVFRYLRIAIFKFAFLYAEFSVKTFDRFCLRLLGFSLKDLGCWKLSAGLGIAQTGGMLLCTLTGLRTKANNCEPQDLADKQNNRTFVAVKVK